LARRAAKALGVALVAVAVGLAGFSCYVSYRMLHPKRGPPSELPSKYGLSYINVTFHSRDGVLLRGWYIPGETDAAVILVHGLHSRKEKLLPLAAELNKAGFSILMFDLRAHGESEGEYTTFGLREVLDLLGALDYLLNRTDVSPEKIGVVGFSMGGSVAIEGAGASERFKAVVADCPYATFTGAVDYGFSEFTGLPSFLLKDMIVFFGEMASGIELDDIRPVDYAAKMRPEQALFIICSKGDRIVDYRDGLLLYEKSTCSRDRKLLWVDEDAPHCGIFKQHPEEYVRRVAEFLRANLLGG